VYTYKDGKLAFVWSGNEDSGYWLLNCNSVYVFVLEGEDMKYLAHYESSLDQPDTHYDYSNRLHPSNPYEVYFK